MHHLSSLRLQFPLQSRTVHRLITLTAFSQEHLLHSSKDEHECLRVY
jgi:hypothetical protein